MRTVGTVLGLLCLSLGFGCMQAEPAGEVSAPESLSQLARPMAATPAAPLDEAEAQAEMEGLELPDLGLGQSTEFNTEAYDRIYENPFLLARHNPLSTFSIDVDTASYSNVRRMLRQGRLPPRGAVRIEEMINYFRYDYPPPEGDVPFSVHVEIAPCPWQEGHRLARIGLKGRVIEQEERPPANLVFLLDVSGSMDQPNKLPLLKAAMRMLVDQLQPRDRVGIVVYAGASGVVLEPTSCETKKPILEALERLRAGGSTAGSEGIQLAYEVAQRYYAPSGINRVILCTDGDFNVGITDRSELVRLVEEKAKSGVFLSVLGFGMGNYKDATLEQLADKGNGNYAYIDTILEARNVLVEQLGGTLVTIAKDVKIQVDFNPAHVAAYRLIGYENRLLRPEDFTDDSKDAGEIGAGHTVTALYQLVPPGMEESVRRMPQSKYQRPGELSEAAKSEEILTVHLRYKEPDADTSREVSFPIATAQAELDEASADFHFAAAVAAFGMLLGDSQYRGTASYDLVRQLAQAGRGEDPNGYRAEFLQLVQLAEALSGP